MRLTFPFQRSVQSLSALKCRPTLYVFNIFMKVGFIMKCQLVGYNEYTVMKNKETGEVDNALTLSFVRNPKISESGAVGKVAVSCTLYGKQIDAIREKVDLKVDTVFDCDINSFKGKNYLNDISKI